MNVRPFAFVLAASALAALPARGARADDLVERRSPVVRAVEKARPGVVSIRTNQIVNVPRYYNWFEYDTVPEEREGSLGTGVIFDPQGFVITNAHVISRATRIFVTIGDGTAAQMEREGKLVAVDLDNDLAIVRLIPPEGATQATVYPFLALGRSNDLLIGETVVAIGNPFRLGTTVTTGVISAIRRSIKPKQGQETEFKDFVQIDAAINPGNSGGPIVDINGRWIGVNTAILNRSTGAEGIGFAIPADRVREMIGRSFKRRAWTGEWFGFDVDAGPNGRVVVRDVGAQGPAADKGLRRGDVITSVGGRPTPTMYDFRLAEAALAKGEAEKLQVARGEGDGVDLEIPSKGFAAGSLSRERFGFVARDATAEDAQRLGIGPDGGVVVTEIVPQGPAERIRLRAADVVTALGSERIRNLDDLATFLEMVHPGDGVGLRIQRVVTDRFGATGVREAQATLVAE